MSAAIGEARPDMEAPKIGEVRLFGEKICQFIERELEGEKWEVVGFVSPAEPDTVSTDTKVGTEAEGRSAPTIPPVKTGEG